MELAEFTSEALMDIRVRPAARSEEARYQERMARHHSLGALAKIGETLWYVAIWREERVACPASTISSPRPADDAREGRLLIPAPGTRVQGKLPVRLQAAVRHDRVSIQVPEGFQMDELPDAVHIRNNHGEFRANWKMAGTKVELKQTFALFNSTAPAVEYAKARTFFAHAGRGAALVLVKK